MRVCFGVDLSIWLFGLISIGIFTTLAVVRTIERFKVGFIFSGFVILFMIILLSTLNGIIIHDRGGEAGPEWEAFNSSQYFTMVGLAFYMFEGVTSVLPILEASNEEARSSFTVLLISALSILLFLNIGFSELCYYAWGSDLKEPIIIWQFPDDNLAVITGRILLCIVILFSFPLQIFTANNNIEHWIFSKMEYSEVRRWLKNLSRLVVVSLAVIISITFYFCLHKILGLTGVLLGSIVVLVMPSLIHNKLMATSTFQKSMNYCVIAYALVMIIVVSFFIIYYWDNK